MDKRDLFIKVEYVVAWAHCKVPLSERTFDGLDEAIEFAKEFVEEPSIRVEEVAVKTQIKITAKKQDIENYVIMGL